LGTCFLSDVYSRWVLNSLMDSPYAHTASLKFSIVRLKVTLGYQPRVQVQISVSQEGKT
jgi:hypothetical protein